MREKEHYRNHERCFGQVYFSLWLFHEQLILFYKSRDILTERIERSTSLQQVENKAETVPADSLYVLRTSHCMVKTSPAAFPEWKVVTRP